MLPAWIAAPLELALLACIPQRGERLEGARHGLWVRRLPGGRVFSETTYEHGLRHGRERRWYLDGSPRSAGEWKHGSRSGEWFYMRREGRLDAERTGVYENGHKIAPVRGFNDWK